MTDAAPERIMALGHRAAMLQPETEPGPMRLVLYRSGRREREVDTVQEAQRAIAEDDGLMAWVALAEPDREQLTRVARTFGVPDLVLEDALTAHQRPKAEIYHDVLFVVLRPAHYNDEAEQVVVGEVHLFASKNVAITIQHTDHIDLEAVRDRLETEHHILAQGPLGVVYAVLDRVVDAYAPVVAGLQEDIDELENQVFDGEQGLPAALTVSLVRSSSSNVPWTRSRNSWANSWPPWNTPTGPNRGCHTCKGHRTSRP